MSVWIMSITSPWSLETVLVRIWRIAAYLCRAEKSISLKHSKGNQECMMCMCMSFLYVQLYVCKPIIESRIHHYVQDITNSCLKGCSVSGIHLTGLSYYWAYFGKCFMKDQVNNAGELLHVDITTLVQIGLFLIFTQIRIYCYINRTVVKCTHIWESFLNYFVLFANHFQMHAIEHQISAEVYISTAPCRTW